VVCLREAGAPKVVVSVNVSTYYLRDSWNRPNAFAVLTAEYFGKAKIETVEYWTLRNAFGTATDASLDTTRRQMAVQSNKDFHIASRLIEKTIRRTEEYEQATKSDPYKVMRVQCGLVCRREEEAMAGRQRWREEAEEEEDLRGAPNFGPTRCRDT